VPGSLDKSLFLAIVKSLYRSVPVKSWRSGVEFAPSKKTPEVNCLAMKNRCVVALFFFLQCSVGSADTYFIEPVYEIPQFWARPGETVTHIDAPLIRTDAQTESEACNQLVYMIGTLPGGQVAATVCKAAGREIKTHPQFCSHKKFRTPKVSGGRIARIQLRETKPVFISQVNEESNPGSERLRTCDINLSWNPANRDNRDRAYERYYTSYGGALMLVQPGDRNPHRP
jgi:hypothetical protein